MTQATDGTFGPYDPLSRGTDDSGIALDFDERQRARDEALLAGISRDYRPTGGLA